MGTSDDAITFCCTDCGVELEMPIDAVGEEVDCPECDVVLIVPEPTPRVADPMPLRTAVVREKLPSEVDRRETPASDSTEPYRAEICVICGVEQRPYIEACPACGTPYHIDFLSQRKRPRGIFVGEILQTSVRLFFSRFSVLAPAILIETGIAIVLYAALRRAMAIGIQWRADALVIAVVCAIYCTYHVLHVGHFRFMLAIARGDAVEPHRLIWPTSGRAYIRPSVKMLLVSTMFWGATFFGLLFGIVPGFVFALLAWPCGRVIVDRDIPAGLAISQAIDLTVPHWPGVLSLTAFLFAVQFAVGLIAVGIGQVLAPLIVLCVVVPFSSLVLTVTYLRLSDEPTGVDNSPERDTL